jgi:uncharacterized protein
MTVACITGASAGIGAAFARQLAAQGHDLILTARREDRLNALRDDLQAAHNITVTVIPADLSVRADVARLAGVIAQTDALTVLVNNAGFGTMGDFAASDIDQQIAMVDVHINATMALCRAALPGMIALKRGDIINVSSIAAFLNGTTYSASKAYLNTFSSGLQAEVKPHGIRVQALCPGYTYTEFHDTPEYDDFSREQIPQSMWQTADEVVQFSLNKRGGKVVIIPGWRNRFLVFSMRTGLRPVVRRVRDWLYRRKK